MHPLQTPQHKPPPPPPTQTPPNTNPTQHKPPLTQTPPNTNTSTQASPKPNITKHNFLNTNTLNINPHPKIPSKPHPNPTQTPPKPHPNPTQTTPKSHPNPTQIPPKPHPNPTQIPPKSHPNPTQTPPNPQQTTLTLFHPQNLLSKHLGNILCRVDPVDCPVHLQVRYIQVDALEGLCGVWVLIDITTWVLTKNRLSIN